MAAGYLIKDAVFARKMGLSEEVPACKYAFRTLAIDFRRNIGKYYLSSPHEVDWMTTGSL